MTIALAVVAIVGWGLLALSIRSTLSHAARADHWLERFRSADALRASYLKRIDYLERRLAARPDRSAA